MVRRMDDTTLFNTDWDKPTLFNTDRKKSRIEAADDEVNDKWPNNLLDRLISFLWCNS